MGTDVSTPLIIYISEYQIKVLCLKIQFVYLENINLILAFIINKISQLNEHPNISSAFILCHNTEMRVILYFIPL